MSNHKYKRIVINNVELYLKSTDRFSNNSWKALYVDMIPILYESIADSCYYSLKCDKGCHKCILSNDIDYIIHEYGDFYIPVMCMYLNDSSIKIYDSLENSIDAIVGDITTIISSMYNFDIANKMSSRLLNNLNKLIYDDIIFKVKDYESKKS